MTLILTALCKNGVCVCADKRSKTQSSQTTSNIDDNQYKIHSFKDGSLIFFNHGVNKFNKKTWRELCLDYENSNIWHDKNLEEISEDFKQFAGTEVKKQLESNLRNFPNIESLKASFFNLCGKNIQTGRFEMVELYWHIDSKGFHFESKSHRGFVRSGDGKKYTEKYVNSRNELNTIDYWENMDIVRAKEELCQLFSIAITEKKKLNGNEFSDEFNTECMRK